MSQLTKYRPLNGNVLIEKVAQEERTAGGVILPTAVQEGRGKLLKGRVIRVASDVYNGEPIPLKENEIVYFRSGIGFDVMLDAKPYIILKAGQLELVDTEV